MKKIKKWEYKYIEIPDEQYGSTYLLNLHGEQGWEFTGHTYDTGYGVRFLLKRSFND